MRPRYPSVLLRRLARWVFKPGVTDEEAAAALSMLAEHPDW